MTIIEIFPRKLISTCDAYTEDLEFYGHLEVVEPTKISRNSLRCQICVFLVEVLQLLRCVSLEWSLSRQALEHNRAERPEI